MRDRRISDLFDLKSRFLRSVQLERDFRDPAALAGYVPSCRGPTKAECQAISLLWTAAREGV
jgi:hypothetical protein